VTDIVGIETRSRMMSGIRGKNTKPEVLVRRALFAAGFRFRLHRRDLPGAPDVVLPGRRLAIFIHGCFWHMHEGCRLAKLPATRPDFWKTKLEENVERDRRNIEALLGQDWRVLVVWECATRNKAADSTLPETLSAWIKGTARLGEISGDGKP
jgi:DNA mismatch endonuclease (patch repair protein)